MQTFLPSPAVAFVGFAAFTAQLKGNRRLLWLIYSSSLNSLTKYAFSKSCVSSDCIATYSVQQGLTKITN